MSVRMSLCAIVLATTASLFGQNSKKEILTDQHMEAFSSQVTAKAEATIGENDKLDLYNIRNYKYTLEPDKGKDYKDYQVIKLDELNSHDLIVGLITHSLKRETRYVEIGRYPKNKMVKEILENNADYVFVNPEEQQYYITPQGEYKYIDGKEVVGSKKVINYLEKGKPITVATFYFAMRNRGIIDGTISLRTFISLSLEQQIQHTRLDIYASAREKKPTP